MTVNLEQIAKEAVEHVGSNTPDIIIDAVGSFIFDIKMWKEGKGNAIDMANSIAQVKVAIEMAKKYYGIPEEMIEGWIEQSLNGE